MKNFTLLRFTAILAIVAGSLSPVRAQYCSPSFANGCSLWGAQSVTLTTINWTLGSSPCTDFDYTWMFANVTTGIMHLLTVDNNDWCGCAVWIDYNQDSIFDPSENIFYQYLANQNNTYNIYFAVPNGTAVGQYRMRIISPWGSDGFQNTNINGYGPCGSFQYGSFQDFTLNVTGPQGIDELAGNNTSWMSAALNRESNEVTVSVHDLQSKMITLQLADISGRIVERRVVTNQKEVFDVSALPAGIYVMNYSDGSHRQSIKLVK